jgi:hypothetical protein
LILATMRELAQLTLVAAAENAGKQTVEH